MSYLPITTLAREYADVTATYVTGPIVLPNPLWGHVVYMSLPPIAMSAALCLVNNWLHANKAGPHDNFIIPLNSQRFDTDYCRLILSYIPVNSEVKETSLFTCSRNRDPPPPHPPSTGVIMFTKPLILPDPAVKLPSYRYGLGRLWAPGLLTGEWAGEGDVSTILFFS